MLEWIHELITNPYLITAVFAWFIAQVIKTIIYYILNKEIRLERLVGDGGMPSGHSATVCSLAGLSLLMFGPGSFEFGISALLAIIVCHDAMGVRQQAGKHAMLLNELLKSFETLTTNALPEVKLKEFVGHTPVQVVAGVLLGAANAIVLYLLVY